MVIEPLVRMGPPPRSLAPEASDCFMVRFLRGGHRIQGCGAIVARCGGLPSECWRTAKLWRFNCGAQSRAVQHTPCGMEPFRYVTENRTCHKVANPAASTPSVTPNDRRDIALATKPSNHPPRSVTVSRRTDGPELNAGTTPSPSWSRCKPSMPPGTTRCPTACAIVRRPRRYRPLSISISKS